MLAAARQRKQEGLHVVVGIVDTHNRPETEALLSGLETVPPRSNPNRNFASAEMDIEAVLNRQPQLVMVDELAHANPPGSRHSRRYQDIVELLQAGIDVYSTLNIQQIESLNDVVSQITGMKVGETIPDSVLDSVTDIELVDLPPDELIQRLAEGKVSIPANMNGTAVQEFFRKGNLTALRELALRRAAERVDLQMRAYMRTQRYFRALAGQRTAAGLHRGGSPGGAPDPHHPPDGGPA